MLLIPESSWEVRGRAFSSDDYGKNNRGIFALQPIPAGTVVGDYLGLLIPNEQEAEYDSVRDVYVMYYDAELSIWPDPSQPGIHLVNHACEPNCGIVTYQGHSLYVALRKIHPEEELTVSYLLAPIDDECAPCRHACRCRARSCTGSMHLPIDRYAAWRQFDERQSRRGAAKRDRTSHATAPAVAYQPLPPLDRYPARVPDRGFFGLYGAPEQPPLVMSSDRLPSVAELRRTIRRTGRRLVYPMLGLTVLGTEGRTIILEDSRGA
jgi:hypothetical protein